MEAEVISTMIESGAALATLIGSGTVKAITAKVQSLKTEKNIDKIRAGYDEIITQILQERADAILLAQTYKTELDKIEISDEDIEHLQNTVSNVIDIFKRLSPNTQIANTQIDSLETIKDLISVDTLKTMQLLGFNYKSAIGEPLTVLCANAISNLGNKKSSSNNNVKRK